TDKDPAGHRIYRIRGVGICSAIDKVGRRGETNRTGGIAKVVAFTPTALAADLDRMLALQIIECVGKHPCGHKAPLREARGAAEIKPKVANRDLRQPNRSSNAVRNAVST